MRVAQTAEMNKIWPDVYDKRYIHWLQLEAAVEAHSLRILCLGNSF